MIAGKPVLFGQPRLEEFAAFLAIHPGEVFSRSQIAYRFWPDSAEKQARTNTRQLLYKLKQAWNGIERVVCIDRNSVTWRTDAPVTVDGWTPRNFDGRFRGEVTLSEAMADSLNTVAVRVAGKAGYARVVDTARRLGVTSELDATPSLALGAGEITLLELTGAYAVFANGGLGVWPYGISEIRDREGRVLYRRTGSGPGRVIEPRYVTAMNRMLMKVTTEGTGKAAILDRPAAGKTGTSQNFRDAWFVGFTADLVTGIWMGNDDASPTRKVTGGSLPARTWQSYMTAAHTGVPARSLPETDLRVTPPQEGFWGRLMATLKGNDG